MSIQEENNKVCPFLGTQFNQEVCLTTISHTVTREGKKLSIYQEVLDFDVSKCETIWKDCPDYKKEICFEELKKKGIQ